jgi:hypothetical protein
MATIDERVSRRRLLKRAGVGAAVLGAGAMVTAGSGAGATFGNCDACHCGVCSGQVPCTPFNAWCVPTTEGCCFCHQSSNCGCLDTCDATSDCPAGWACALTCCGLEPVCVPPRGIHVSCAAAVAGGQKSGKS